MVLLLLLLLLLLLGGAARPVFLPDAIERREHQETNNRSGVVWVNHVGSELIEVFREETRASKDDPSSQQGCEIKGQYLHDEKDGVA